ncbi:MAG: glycosyltransferase family 4 protein [Desulfococcaceae bacterium]
MKKYLALSQKYLPHKGGAFIWVHELCKRLHNATVLTETVKGCPAQEMIENVDVRRIRLERLAFLRPESLVMYANLMIHTIRFCMQNRPDAIIAARVLPEGLTAVIAGRIFGIKNLILAHGEEITTWGTETELNSRRKITGAFKRHILWSVYRWADHIAANSGFTCRELTEGGICPEKIRIVHPGTDPEQFKPLPDKNALKAKWQVENRKVLLTVGRLSKRKGQDMVIAAMPSILKSVPKAIYLIGGIGEYETRLKKLVKDSDLSSHVRFLGKVSDESLLELYNIADIFLMPNRILTGNDVEGFGIVFLEANACEIPVIGGNSGGVPDAVVHGLTGILTQGDSPEEIAGAVIRLLENPAMAKKMGQEGRKRVCRELTWNHNAENIRTILESKI